MRKRKGRTCDLCGRRYFRRNLVEAWDGQSPGKRKGWHKSSLRVCTECAGPRQAERMLTVATVRLVKGKRRRAS
jgi:hypothetical protein